MNEWTLKILTRPGKSLFVINPSNQSVRIVSKDESTELSLDQAKQLLLEELDARRKRIIFALRARTDLNSMSDTLYYSSIVIHRIRDILDQIARLEKKLNA